jgi:hypothetical protein
MLQAVDLLLNEGVPPANILYATFDIRQNAGVQHQLLLRAVV